MGCDIKPLNDDPILEEQHFSAAAKVHTPEADSKVVRRRLLWLQVRRLQVEICGMASVAARAPALRKYRVHHVGVLSNLV